MVFTEMNFCLQIILTITKFFPSILIEERRNNERNNMRDRQTVGNISRVTRAEKTAMKDQLSFGGINRYIPVFYHSVNKHLQKNG